MGTRYEVEKWKRVTVLLGLTLCMILSALWFMTIHMEISVFSIPDILYRAMDNQLLTAQEKIVLYMRMPSVLMAIAAGMALSISGGVMQSVTHNDLVSPFTLGISAAAAFGASLCIVSENPMLHSTVGMIGGAFLAACICILCVYGISLRTGTTASVLVLTGIAMNYFFSALSATVQFFAQEYKLGEIIQWTFGTLNKANWSFVGCSFGILLIGILLFFYLALPLDAMAVNDDEMVKSLGIQPQKIRFITGLVSVFLTATIISFTGVIGFVGLIAPHMARMAVGNRHRIFLPMAGVMGACLLLYADMIGRYILYPVSIPVGIVISFLGVPLFIQLVMKMRGRDL